jgi:hypothetical protein
MRPVDLREHLEDGGRFSRRDADARVGDGDDGFVSVPLRRHADPAARRRVLAAVVEQVVEICVRRTGSAFT